MLLDVLLLLQTSKKTVINLVYEFFISCTATADIGTILFFSMSFGISIREENLGGHKSSFSCKNSGPWVTLQLEYPLIIHQQD